MSLTLEKWCSYSKLTTQTKQQARGACFIQYQKLNKRKHTQTCIKAMLDTDGDDFRALKRIVKLNSAIQNRSVKEFFELACDECMFLFNSLPPFNPFSLSKRAFILLHDLMLHNNMTFVIRPTANEGFEIGIKWSRALPLTLDDSIHTSHIYKGHLTLRKASHILEALLHMGNLSQIVPEKIMLLLDKIVPKDMIEGQRREAFMHVLLSLVVIYISYILMKKAM
ncbi:hypothetical protein LUZ62_050793 [Rhynchospora pubera]|uniref:Uncharacterized protein n=1 Tax=Rhynchospora pubera TaxID=906938 RepID=A0AAV8GAH1_9POAL|nr:hypothetical protein LUZ62_050793 [Rhynchospora pubera]